MKRSPIVDRNPARQIGFGKQVIHIIEPGSGGLPKSLNVFSGDYAIITRTRQVLKMVNGKWKLLGLGSLERREVIWTAREEGVIW